MRPEDSVSKARIIDVLYFDVCVPKVEHVKNFLKKEREHLLALFVPFVVYSFAEYRVPVAQDRWEKLEIHAFGYEQMSSLDSVVVICHKHIWLASFAVL